MPRKFSMINANGATWDLSSQSSFLTDPSGLGFEWSYDFDNYDNYFVMQSDPELKQPAPAGKIRFADYETYYKFALFAQYTPLTLVYTAYKTFYMDVVIKKLEKTDISKGCLTSAITLSGITPWYETITLFNTAKTGGKRYPYTNPYTYIDTETGVVEFTVESNMSSGVKMTILGPLTNPTWSHVVNGTKINSGKVTVTISGGHRFVVDSTGSPYSITERDSGNDLVKDLYQKSDWSTGRFIRLKPGSNMISCAQEGTEQISMILEARIYYAGI